MKNKQPLISIVMPVYNAGKFLPECIASVKKQTHKNWELIAIDDHSSDNSYSILRKYAKTDKRIRIFKNYKNLGGPSSANLAVKKAKSKWIARMDADDVMLPTRLAEQLKTLQDHPSVVVIGSQCNLIDENSKKTGQKLFPTCPKEIFNMLFWACPVQQPSIMVNANRLPSYFQWYHNVRICEEISFLIRISKFGNIVNSKKVLLDYRMHSANLSKKDSQKKVFFNQFNTRIKAVISGLYKPSFASLLIGFSELLIVLVLPEKAILPMFILFRGMKNFKLNISLPSFFPKNRTIQLSV